MCHNNAYLLYNGTQSEHGKGGQKIVYLCLGRNRQTPDYGRVDSTQSGPH